MRFLHGYAKNGSMDFKSIESFFTLSETLHFSKAASRRGLSQPAFSRQIQSLEEDLGQSLVIRQRSGVVLTPFGRSFLDEVAPLFRQMKFKFDELSGAANELRGEYTIGTYSEIGQNIIMPLVLKLQKENPELVIHLKFSKTEELFEGVKSGQYDMGLFIPPNDQHSLLTYLLTEETQILVAGTKEAAENFPGERAELIAYSKTEPNMRLLQKKYQEHFGKIHWWTSLSVNSLPSIIDALKGTHRYAVMPSHRASHKILRGELFPVKGPVLSSKLYLVQSEEFRSEFRSKAIRSYLIKAFKEMKL